MTARALGETALELACFRRLRRAGPARSAAPCLLAVDEAADPQARARGAAAMFHVCREQAALRPEDQAGLVVHPLEPRGGHPFADLLTLGSAEDNDVVLAHPLVSWFHAYLAQDPSRGGWTLHDVGSARGTRVDGVEAPPERPLRSRSLIEVSGSLLLVFLEPRDVDACLLAPCDA
ncbi:MAG: FHA domain-containing protein [Planctomycetota bacterium]